MTTTVAIHQPNYFPWLGYFHKIARADVFVFLDDAQFTKNSYINRVRVRGPGGAKWLTVPVSVHLGDPIAAVLPADADWRRRHAETLRQYYRGAPAFAAAWPAVEALLSTAPDASLAAINRHLVEGVAGLLGLACRFEVASALGADACGGDERLVALTSAVAPGGAYLSGRGGANYQDPAKFAAAGLGFAYTEFVPPLYDQGAADFVPGLSVLDAALRLGWAETAALLA